MIDNDVNDVGQNTLPLIPEYVVGFAYNNECVLFLLKSKPEDQKGKLNGVGGKMEKEDNYSPFKAMQREWTEEINGALDVQPDWEYKGLFYGEEWNVHVFSAKTYAELASLNGKGNDIGERFVAVPLNAINTWVKNLGMPNLKWILPLVFDERVRQFTISFKPKEIRDDTDKETKSN